jgi:WS/DGAT/MGAT family acyltransferase
MQQLSGQDAMFIHSELDGLPQHIGGMSIYNQDTAPGGKVRFKQILAYLESRVHLSPIFTRKLVTVPWSLDQPYWIEDPDFNLEYHVRHIALPKPGDWRQLCILAARLHSQPLARNHPLWEMYIIEGLSGIEGIPANSFAVLQKVHHAAMDGATGMQLAAAMHDLEPIPREIDPPPVRRAEKVSRPELYLRALKNNLAKPGQFIEFGRQLLPTWQRIQRGKKEQLFKSLDNKQKTRFQGKISRHRVVDRRTFDFEAVREIKNTYPGATINDAMLTIVAGAMRRYLTAKDELPEDTLVTGCPIDVRDEQERNAGGNMVGFMNVALRTDIADPLERMEAIHQEAQGSKAYSEALGPRIAMNITDTLPGGVLATAMRVASSTGLMEMNVIHNTIVTNVPGPPVQLYFCGAELVESLSFGPLLPNVGLFHIVLSSVQNKKGIISVSFTACRDMMPDPAFYSECLQESFDELRDAALKKGRSNNAKAKKTANSKAPASKRKASNPTKRKAAATKIKAKPRTKTKAKPKSADSSAATTRKRPAKKPIKTGTSAANLTRNS